MIRVASIRPRSIADDLGLRPGYSLLSINAAVLRDSLDLRFYEADESLELEVLSLEGQRVVFEIEKDAAESLGIIPHPDKVRRCTNACAFCFVKGNPKAEKLRSSLYIKDDDYRLSFMFGHYVTLTNLAEEDWKRIREQRLSPLYVSVHATDPSVRLAMLKNPRSANIGEHLDRLAASGIGVHAQVVLCADLNDGDRLESTMADLYDRGDAILSLSIVPVGLTSFNQDRGIRPLTAAEGQGALEQIDRIRERAKVERGRGWCFAADELFLLSRQETPGSDYFDDPEIIGNGVGAMSLLADQVRRDLDRLPARAGERILLITGTSMAPTLERLAEEMRAACGAREIRTVAVKNSLYGPLVTTAGLLPGQDHLAAIKSCESFDRAIFSRSAMNENDVFLDDMSLEELRTVHPTVSICPSEHVTDVLIPA